MNPQAAVYVNGVRVGSVEQIAVLDRSTVEVGVRINTTKIRIPQGSEFVILPNGVVGAKYVEILLPPPSSKPTYLTEKSISWGEDPVRPEIVVNELAEKLSNIDFQVVQDKLARGMDSMNYAAQRISTLSRKLEPAAEKLGPAVEKLGPAAAGATVAEENVTALAKDLREPVQQMHQIMDQRHPLLHMIFGRPGHVKKQEKMKTTTTTAGDGTGLEKKSRIEVQTKDDNVPRASDAEVVSEKHQKHKKHHRNEADE
jgi:ABC-type transporter Mla subunit MlaD